MNTKHKSYDKENLKTWEYKNVRCYILKFLSFVYYKIYTQCIMFISIYLKRSGLLYLDILYKPCIVI
jgi:hypothetical protein